ncbi:hypothetical protein C5167_047913 [Papaver somniferum]|uniref:Uncharacterized protein n=1 Tax=Papaver somniferum TaxID=3469 RepID=A0A4Y7KHU3_PAPSO|nr:hypothetical protein C5167_047913 [Papaver somniferum]
MIDFCLFLQLILLGFETKFHRNLKRNNKDEVDSFLIKFVFFYSFIFLLKEAGDGTDHEDYYLSLESVSHQMYYASNFREPQIQVAKKVI